ncbi:MAG: hypothetical protein MI747_14445, partial [Desulfobacterales bacterium]|nr:hypothetical protein [Desulfobacterales bacterium]
MPQPYTTTVVPTDTEQENSGIFIVGPDYSATADTPDQAQEQSQAAVDNISSIVQTLMEGDLTDYGIHDPALTNQIQDILSELASESESANFHPETIGDLTSDHFNLPEGSGDIAIPENVGVVVMVDPNIPDSASFLRFYRSSEALGGYESTVPVVVVGPDFEAGSYNEHIADLLGRFVHANEVRNGRYGRSTADAASRLVWDINLEMGTARHRVWGLDSGSLNSTSRPDRIGFEIEAPAWVETPDGLRLDKWTRFGATSESELGYSVLSLELDISPGSRYGLFEIVTGPLTTSELMSPEYHQALNILRETIDQATEEDGEWSVQDVLDTYNRRLAEELGGDGERYHLNSDDPARNRTFTVSAGDGAEGSLDYYYHQANVLVAYGDLGTEAFLNSLFQNEGLYGPAQAAADHVDELLTEMGFDPAAARPEMRAFVFQILFNEMLGLEGEGFYQSKENYDLLLRFSPEDALFAVLNDDEVETIASWYEEHGTDRVRTILGDEYGAAAAAEIPGFEARMENIFDYGASKRLELGKQPLLVNRDFTDSFSPLPGEGGGIIEHSMPTGFSRVPLVEHNGQIFGAVEYRLDTIFNTHPPTSPSDWMEGHFATVVSDLVTGEPPV